LLATFDLKINCCEVAKPKKWKLADLNSIASGSFVNIYVFHHDPRKFIAKKEEKNPLKFVPSHTSSCAAAPELLTSSFSQNSIGSVSALASLTHSQQVFSCLFYG